MKGYWTGKKRPPFSPEWIENLKKAKKRQKERDGYINSPEARIKLSKALKGRPKTEAQKEKLRGSNSNFWRGGRSSEMRISRERSEYKEWRKKVFERDNHTCQECGRVGGILQADHKIPYCVLPHYMRYDLDNGRTLCEPCHKKTWSYGNGARKFREELEKVYPSS